MNWFDLSKSISTYLFLVPSLTTCSLMVGTLTSDPLAPSLVRPEVGELRDKRRKQPFWINFRSCASASWLTTRRSTWWEKGEPQLNWFKIYLKKHEPLISGLRFILSVELSLPTLEINGSDYWGSQTGNQHMPEKYLEPQNFVCLLILYFTLIRHSQDYS